MEDTNIHPKVMMALYKQINELQKKSPDGVRFVPNEYENEVHADIDGPVSTPYEGGVFRCKLVLNSEFPRVPPKGYFITKIFHPNISPKGEICVNSLKKDWNPQAWSLYHIFEVVKCLLVVPFPESALNEEAGKMFMDDYEEYRRHAKMMTQLYATPKDRTGRSPTKPTGGDNEVKRNKDAMSISPTPADRTKGVTRTENIFETQETQNSQFTKENITIASKGSLVKQDQFSVANDNKMQEEVVLSTVTNSLFSAALNSNGSNGFNENSMSLKKPSMMGPDNSGLNFNTSQNTKPVTTAPVKKENEKKLWMKRI